MTKPRPIAITRFLRVHDRVTDSMKIGVWNYVEDRVESRLEDLVWIPIWFRLFRELNHDRKIGVS